MTKTPPPPRREPPDPPREHPFVRAARDTGIIPPERDMTKFQNAGINAMPPCKIRQWSDMTGCITEGCGLKWDTNDSRPPLCPRWAVARGKVAVPGYPSSCPSRSPLLAGSAWQFWASLIILAAAIGWVHGTDILAWLGL